MIYLSRHGREKKPLPVPDLKPLNAAAANGECHKGETPGWVWLKATNVTARGERSEPRVRIPKRVEPCKGDPVPQPGLRIVSNPGHAWHRLVGYR